MTELLEEDGPEKTPLPLDLIDKFGRNHSALIKGVKSTLKQPSTAGMTVVEENAQKAVGVVSVFYQNDFFRDDASEDMMVETILREVMRATEEVVALINEIEPQTPIMIDYSKENERNALERIMDDDEEIKERQVSRLYNNYDMLVEKLNCALSDCEIVSNFMKRQEKREQIKEVLADVGIKAAATYIGVALALKLHNRK